MKRMTLAKPRAVDALTVAAFTVLSSPAFAQLDPVKQKFSYLQIFLGGLGAVLFTIAIMIGAYKMAFQHAKFHDVSQIFLGGVLFGCAGAIGAWLVG